jgi:GWxTD domain-containing protein
MKFIQRLFLPGLLLFVGAASTLSAVQRYQFSPPRPAYEKWLNEDVVYIIDDAERGAFQRLVTDEERDHFMEQFWERRGPKSRSEHYRRLEFANKRFTTASGMPGWQTDRGHMYILYGPPDEIDSHPKGAPHPWESWGYKHIEGDSEMSFYRFVDSGGNGDFRLAPRSGH